MTDGHASIRIDELHTWAHECHITRRPPDETIGDLDGNPYMRRWHVVRKHELLDRDAPDAIAKLWPHTTPPENIYLHQFIRSDEDRALHDHPWPWTTILLDGSYIEHLSADPGDPTGPTRATQRQPGEIVHRAEAARPHRIELIDGQPVVTLFITWAHWIELYCERQVRPRHQLALRQYMKH
jgi:hypothetical protein